MKKDGKKTSAKMRKTYKWMHGETWRNEGDTSQQRINCNDQHNKCKRCVWLKTRLEFSNNGFTNELSLKERVAISLLNLVCACCFWLTYIITITPKVRTIIVNTSPMSMLKIKLNLTYQIFQWKSFTQPR